MPDALSEFLAGRGPAGGQPVAAEEKPPTDGLSALLADPVRFLAHRWGSEAKPEAEVKGDLERLGGEGAWERAQGAFRSGVAQNKYAGAEESGARYFLRRSVPGFSAGFRFGESLKTTRAQRRIAAGEGTQADYDEVAQAERLQQIDKARDAGQAAFGALASAPAVLGEAVTGAGAARAVGSRLGGLLGLGSRAAPAVGAAPTAAQAVAPSLARRAATAAVREGAVGAASTPAMPSLWLSQAQEKARVNGGYWFDSNNISGPALYAVMNAAVLGHAAKLGTALQAPRLARAAAGGSAGLAEQQAGDAAFTYLEDRYLPEAARLNTRYGAVGKLLRGERGEGMKELAAQAVTMAFVAGLSPRRPAPEKSSEFYDPNAAPKLLGEGGPPRAEPVDEPPRPTPPGWRKDPPQRVMDAFQESMNAYARRGYAAERVAEEMGRVKEFFDALGSNLPADRIRAEVARRFGRTSARSFADAVADSIAPLDVEVGTVPTARPAATPRPAIGPARPLPGGLRGLPSSPGRLPEPPQPVTPSPAPPFSPMARPAPQWFMPRLTPPGSPKTPQDGPGVAPPPDGLGAGDRPTAGESGGPTGRPTGLRLVGQEEPLKHTDRDLGPEEREAIRKFGSGQVFRLHIVDGEGNRVGRAAVVEEATAAGPIIHVPWLGRLGMASGEGRGAAQPFGAGEMRAVAEQIAQLVPDATLVKFTPGEGRRRAGAQLAFERVNDTSRPLGFRLRPAKDRSAPLPPVDPDDPTVPPLGVEPVGTVPTKLSARLRAVPKDLRREVARRFGGIDPEGADFLTHFGGAKEAREFGLGFPGLFRKGGKGLDELAAELHNEGLIVAPDPETRVQVLVDALKGGRKTALSVEDAAGAAEAAFREREQADADAQAADALAEFLGAAPTDRQAETLRAVATEGGQAEAAAALGTSRQNVSQVVKKLTARMKGAKKSVAEAAEDVAEGEKLALAERGGQETVTAEGVRVRARMGDRIRMADISGRFDPVTGKALPVKRVKDSPARQQLAKLKADFDALSDEFMTLAERDPDAPGVRERLDDVNRRIAEVTQAGKQLQSELKLKPGETLFSNPLPAAWDAVKSWVGWAAQFRRGVGRVPLDFDHANPLPRFPAWDQFKQIFTTPEGLGRFPLLARMFDPRGTENAPEGLAIIARQAANEVGKNVAALWARANQGAKGLFTMRQDGSMELQGNRHGWMSDVMEAELRRPGSQPITQAQRDWLFNTYKPLLEDFRKMLRDEGVGFFYDQHGNPVNFTEHYFPRPAIGRKGKPSPSGPGQPPRGPQSPGAKSFYEQGREFATEKEGADAGYVYDPDPVSRVAKLIQGGYRAVADHRLANDPALQGTGKLSWLDNRPANMQAPAFRGKFYPPEVADKIETYYAQHSNPMIRGLESVNSFAKAFLTGLDFGVAANQGLMLMFARPQTWARATANMFRAVADPEVMTRYFERPENRLAASELVQGGASVGRLAEYAAGLESGQAATRVPLAGPVLERFGQSFGAFVDTAKVELWKAYRDGTPPEQRQATMEAIENALGVGQMERIGVSPWRAVTERLLLLAPSLYRSGLNLMAMAARRDVPGNLALRMLAGQAVGTAAVAYGGMQAAGLTNEEIAERFDPRSGKFLAVPLQMSDGSVVNLRFGNVMLSYARLAADLAEHYGARPVGAVPTEETGTRRHPILNWLRTHAATAPRVAIDVATGENARGEPQSAAESVARAAAPIPLQDLAFAKDSPLTGSRPRQAAGVEAAAGFLGVQGFGAGESAERQMAVDRAAQGLYGKPYAGLTFPQRARAIQKAGEGLPAKEQASPQAIARAQANDQARARELYAGLSGGAKLRLADAGIAPEKLPGFETHLEVGGVRVPFTQGERATMAGLVAREYEKELAGLPVNFLSGASQARREEAVRKRLTQARERAANQVKAAAGR